MGREVRITKGSGGRSRLRRASDIRARELAREHGPSLSSRSRCVLRHLWCFERRLVAPACAQPSMTIKMFRMAAAASFGPTIYTHTPWLRGPRPPGHLLILRYTILDADPCLKGLAPATTPSSQPRMPAMRSSSRSCPPARSSPGLSAEEPR